MTLFTVEIVAAPAADEAAMDQLRRYLDLVPGTVLIEDPEQPRIYFPVECEGPLAAARFVDGLAKITELTIESGNIYETPEADFESFDDDGDEAEVTPVVEAVREWMAKVPEPESRLNEAGDLVPC